MPIDKLIPRFLVSDEDERLLKEGAMTDALNVTISEDGDGSEGVVKNVKGTDAADPISGLSLPDNSVKVVGSVSDHQLGKIYFFVADSDTTPNGPENAIYQYDTSSDEYKLVFKNGWLNFDPGGFVKADVLNGAFQQDGFIQTILYFTDNHNAPRKINVDRAIAGDYDGLSSDRLDYALNSIKAAPNSPPAVRFSTDANFNINNFRDSTFQFALQYVYIDGEESAISSYSKLVFNDLLASEGVEDFSLVTGKKYFEDNVCLISLNWSSDSSSKLNIPDVEKVRILARNGNDGAFFIVDEFNPNESLSTAVMGTSTQIYDNETCIYRFFNDRVNSPVDLNLVNKLYDNVPLYAASQAISSNRLFYSDYKEGRPNYKPSAAIEAVYESERSGSLDFTNEAGVTHYFDLTSTAYPRNGYIGFNYDTVFNSLDVPSNSTVTLSFDFNPSGSFSRVSPTSDEYVISAFSSSSNGTVSIGFGQMGVNVQTPSFNQNSGGVMIKKAADDFKFNVSITTDATVSPQGFANLLKLELEDNPIFWTQTYTLASNEMPGDVYASTDINYQVGDSFNWGNNTDVSLTWAFDSISIDSNANTLIVEPRISSVSFSKGGVSFSSSAPSQALFVNNTQDNTSIVTQGETWHYDYAAVLFTEFFHGVGIDSIAFDFVRTFKVGCSHDIGIVYYDKYNRSGNVNILGSFYSQPFNHSDREIGSTGAYNNGPTGVKVSFYSDAPDWADRYQLVYAGMNSYSSVFQFTGGGGFYAANTDDKRVYLSLNTLREYRSRKNAIKDYSFTKGDKLRVISRDTAQGSETTNPQNNDDVFANDGSLIDFNVLGIKTISTVEEAVSFFSVPNHSSNPHEELQGDFLILDAPAVDASLSVTAGGQETQLKYPGFDWYQISETDYPNNDSAPTGGKNYWGHSCLFEILTPRAQTEERVYYEVGESYLIDDRYKASQPGGGNPISSTDHGPNKTAFFGDLLFSPRSCVTPWRNANQNEHTNASYANWNEIKIDDWRVETRFMESQSISDFKNLNYWDKGRPHVVFENAATIRRTNGITYSDAYAEDVANLSLSSFNPALGNFDSLDGRYGAVEYIGNYNDDLVALQENKLCLIPVNKNILEYASGSADVAVSTNVLGQRRYSAGDYGSGGHPEAVLIQDNSVYFVDESRQAVCGLIGGQLVPISDKGMSSFFENFFAAGATNYVSGYDPRDNTYYITRRGSNESTVGYDAARGVWQSKYSFVPDVYVNQNNMLYSAKYTSGNNIFWKHDNTAYNTFYGDAYPSTVQVVSKLSPSRVKVFNAISYEGDSDAWETPSATPIQTSLAMFAGQITSWSEREGSYYASIPKDVLNPELIYLGTISSAANNNLLSSTLTMSDMVRFDRLPIDLIATTDPPHSIPLSVGTQVITSFSQPDKEITLFGTFADPASLAGTKLYAKVFSSHALRGHWAKITLENTSTSKHELYCINTHVTDSKSHHPLGQ